MHTGNTPRFKQVRKALGLRQQEVADAIGVTTRSLSAWENGSGSPQLETVRKLAALYNCSIDYLAGFDAESHASGDERELAERYRSMSEADRELLLDTARAINAGHAT